MSLIKGQGYLKWVYATVQRTSQRTSTKIATDAISHALNVPLQEIDRRFASTLAKDFLEAKRQFDIRRLAMMVRSCRIHIPSLSNGLADHEPPEMRAIRSDLARMDLQSIIGNTVSQMKRLEAGNPWLRMVTNYPGVWDSGSRDPAVFSSSAFTAKDNQDREVVFKRYADVDDFDCRSRALIECGDEHRYQPKLCFDDTISVEDVLVTAPPIQSMLLDEFDVCDQLGSVQSHDEILRDSIQDDISIIRYRENQSWSLYEFTDGSLCRLPKNLIEIQGGTFCSIGMISNYYTWVIEVLARILVAREQGLPSPYYVVGTKQAWHAEYLEILGLEDEVCFLDPLRKYKFRNTHLVVTSKFEISNLGALRLLRAKLTEGLHDRSSRGKSFICPEKPFLRTGISSMKKRWKHILCHWDTRFLSRRNSVSVIRSRFSVMPLISLGPTGAWASNLIPSQ